MTGTPTPRRDDEAVSRFIEHFASLLIEAGVPRMPSRAFVALLSADSGRLSAAELADRLQASPAAISGAVRYLMQVGLIGRGREPGSRRDYYEVSNTSWYDAMLNRDHLLVKWRDGARLGAQALGPGTPAGARMIESAEFFDFMRHEVAAMLERWEAHRKKWLER